MGLVIILICFKNVKTKISTNDFMNTAHDLNCSQLRAYLWARLQNNHLA